MRQIVILFAVLFTGIITSCSDDNEPTQFVNHTYNNNDTQETADGEWHLVQVTGSIAGINHLYEPGTITWTFNDNTTVDVINTNTNDALTDFFDSGNYAYSFEENVDAPEMCDSVLFLNGLNFGCQDIDGNTMLLTNTWADGYQLKFISMQ